MNDNKWLKEAEATNEEIKEYVKANYTYGDFEENVYLERQARKECAIVVRYLSRLIDFDRLPDWAQRGLIDAGTEYSDRIERLDVALKEAQ